MKALHNLIGAIVSEFVMLEFVLSVISYDFKFTNSKMEFFANSSTERKFKKLISQFDSSDILKKSEYTTLLVELDNLRAERNTLVHSLILKSVSNNENFMFHDYYLSKNGIENKSRTHNLKHLEKFLENLKSIHKDLYKLHLIQSDH